MIDQELREIMDNIFKMQAETARQMAESKAQTDRRMAESKAEHDRRLAENDREMAEIKQLFKQVDREQLKTDRQLKEMTRKYREAAAITAENGRQIGNLHNKFGGFTEGLAWPSMEKMLREQFGMDNVSRREKTRRGRALEIDLLAYDSTGERNDAYVVEVKSRLRRDDIAQTLKIIAEVPHFFPELKDHEIYGIIAAVDISAAMFEAVKQAGLYLACAGDDMFKLLKPYGFKPKAFGSAVHTNGRANGRKGKKSYGTKGDKQ